MTAINIKNDSEIRKIYEKFVELEKRSTDIRNYCTDKKIPNENCKYNEYLVTTLSEKYREYNILYAEFIKMYKNFLDKNIKNYCKSENISKCKKSDKKNFLPNIFYKKQLILNDMFEEMNRIDENVSLELGSLKKWFEQNLPKQKSPVQNLAVQNLDIQNSPKQFSHRNSITLYPNIKKSYSKIPEYDVNVSKISKKYLFDIQQVKKNNNKIRCKDENKEGLCNTELELLDNLDKPIVLTPWEFPRDGYYLNTILENDINDMIPNVVGSRNFVYRKYNGDDLKLDNEQVYVYNPIMKILSEDAKNFPQLLNIKKDIVKIVSTFFNSGKILNMRVENDRVILYTADTELSDTVSDNYLTNILKNKNSDELDVVKLIIYELYLRTAKKRMQKEAKIWKTEDILDKIYAELSILKQSSPILRKKSKSLKKSKTKAKSRIKKSNTDLTLRKFY